MLLLVAALLAIFAILWFHVIPDRAFGGWRFTIGTSITQILTAVLVNLAGDVGSPYFDIFLIPILATTFAVKVSATIVTGAVAVLAFLGIVAVDFFNGNLSESEIGESAISFASLAGIIAMTALITKTMEETRATLRARTTDLAAQNVELGVAHSVGLALAREHPVVKGPTNCPAIRSGRIFRVSGGADPVICPYMPFRDGSLGYVCAPLLAAGEPIGALFMEPAADSVLEDTFTLAAADRVALAVANRRVLETAQHQATTDGLTGLHNRHFLAEQLRLLQSLADRHKQSYAVVAIDIDDLKRVNDTYGHEIGDLALRGFANVVRKTIRGSDIGVRSGGDEFLVLLPRGGLDDARVLAGRLRDALAAQGRAEPHTAITTSPGVAAWRPGRTAEQVLESADGMLYAAKRAGRDRIMVEGPVAATET